MRPLFAAPNQASIVRLDGSRLTATEVDEMVLRLMKAAQVTGVGIAVINNAKVVYTKAYGFRDVEKQLALTERSVMSAASLTKPAVAYLAMQLVQEGRIALDMPVSSILPKPLAEYPEYRDLAGDPRHLKITPRMLLSHTSGFPNFRSFNPDGKLNINFEPGTRYAYSGEGMLLLQLVLENVAKKPLGELMQERVFSPVGMTRTSMVSEDRFADSVAQGYDQWGRPLGVPNRIRADAAGSMRTTLGDVARFMQAVVRQGRLSNATFNLMLSPQIKIVSKHQFPTLSQEVTDENKKIGLSYGLGWGLYSTPYGKAFFKEGHDDAGFQHYTVMFTRQKTGLVIMTNSLNGEGIFKDLIETLLKNTLTPIEWEGYTPYNQLPPRPALPQHSELRLEPGVLDRFVGHYSMTGATLTVLREGNRMFFQENDEPRVEIFAEGESQFFTKVNDDVFTFEGAPGGKAATLILHVDGRTIPLKRMQ
jgi:CubicO group peptidase (beta-lactamase class C family)